MDIEFIVKTIIESAVTVKATLGSGFLESVYKNALVQELHLRGLSATVEKTIEVRYKGAVVGVFRADILVADCVIIEAKVVAQIEKPHEYQLVNYLKATGIPTGLLINFGETPIKIRRKYRDAVAQ